MIAAHLMNARRPGDVLAALNTWPEQPFRYGQADCCQLVGHVVLELTGRDHMLAFHYETEDQADAMIEAAGGLTPLVSSVLGEPVPVAALQPGDPVLIRWRKLELLGVLVSDRAAAGLDIYGHIAEIPIRICAHGWRV